MFSNNNYIICCYDWETWGQGKNIREFCKWRKFRRKNWTLSIEDEFLDCNLDKVLNMDGNFKDSLLISVLKGDQTKFDSIVASGDGTNDYLNGDHIYTQAAILILVTWLATLKNSHT